MSADAPLEWLVDIGNTHTHVGVLKKGRWILRDHFPTSLWADADPVRPLRDAADGETPDWIGYCSVSPRATGFAGPRLAAAVAKHGACVELTWRNVRGLGIAYPRPESIGADRLANAMAAARLRGGPVVVVDFGTAVTLDVVDAECRYLGGVIAPGVSAMTEYLHEKTALLPRVTLAEPSTAIGRSTEEAMRIGAVRGFRGLIRGLLADIQTELNAPCVPVLATGGCAELIAGAMPEIDAIHPSLTLEGIRLLSPWADQPIQASKNWGNRRINSPVTRTSVASAPNARASQSQNPGGSVTGSP